MNPSMLTDERMLIAYVGGVHMTLLRLGILTFPADVLQDVRDAILRAGPCELRTALMRELEGEQVRVVDAGQHLMEAVDRYNPPPPRVGYR
jgi:hypothetical protein